MIRARVSAMVVTLAMLSPWLVSLSAQEGGATGYPRVFQVKPDKLNLRAGIGQNYKILVTVRQGDQLVGEEEQVGWVRVRPPKGIRCYVSRDFVDGVSGGSGTVNADHVNLRPTPSTTHPPLLQLNRGDSVRIVGEVEGWYEIEAPPAVACWASKEQLIEVGSWTGREATVDVTGGGILPDNSGGGRSTDATPGDTGSGSTASGTVDPGPGTTGTEVPGGTTDPSAGAGTTQVQPPVDHGTAEHPTPGGATTETVAETTPGSTGTAETPAGGTTTPGNDRPTGGTDLGTATPTGEGAGTTDRPDAGTDVGTDIETRETPPDSFDRTPTSPGAASFQEGVRLARAEDEKEVRDQDYRAAMRQFEIALAAGLSPEETLRADVELKRMGSSQKILDELRSQDREIRAISEAERRRQRDEARKRQVQPFVAEGYVDSVGKVIRRPAAHKLMKGKRTLYFLTSIKFNLDDYIGKRIGIRGKIIDSPGWDFRTVIVEELEVLGE